MQHILRDVPRLDVAEVTVGAEEVTRGREVTAALLELCRRLLALAGLLDEVIGGELLEGACRPRAGRPAPAARLELGEVRRGERVSRSVVAQRSPSAIRASCSFVVTSR